MFLRLQPSLKPSLAVDTIRRALAADVPFSWVAAGAVYGVGDVEGLRRACKGYVLGVKSDHHFGSWSGKPPVAGTALEIPRDLDPDVWQRLSAGDGTKGARLHDWACYELADLDADEYSDTETGLWTRGLLIRRNISDGDLAFFSTWCPAGTGIQALVSVEAGALE
jgi:SRSO17 transposase